MKGIPAHFIIRNENIKDLDQMYLEGQSDDDVAILRIEFTKFLKSSFSTYVGPNSLKTEEINSSYYLRLIVDKIFTQISRARRVEDHIIEIPDMDTSSHTFLFELSIKSNAIQSEGVSAPKLNLNKFPNDWKKLSKTRKHSYSVGGPNPDFSSWQALGLHKLPVSSFIIVDPYFLERWNETKLNLKSILDGLIDPKLGVKKFELIIAVRNDPKKPIPKEDIKENQLKVENLLKEAFSKYTFSVTLIYVNKKYTHDRYLFTDFYYLKTGSGFNYYRSDGKFDQLKSNDLDINMLSDEGTFKSYKKRLQAVVEWMNSSDSLYGAEGKLNSRLFEVLR
jgi:hypothetical protein